MAPPLPSDNSPWLNSAQAAEILGIQRASLYSYVSRGLLQAQQQPGQRGKVYARAEVTRLARQRHLVRNPAQLAQSTLDWGPPVLSSAITQVVDGQLFYRGHHAVQLAASHSLETIAHLLLEQKWSPALTESAPTATQSIAKPAIPRNPGQALAAWHQSAQDEISGPLQPLRLLAVLQHMADVLAGQPVRTMTQHLHHLRTTQQFCPAHMRLGQIWNADAASCHILRQALVLCADHELNASSFTARVVASTGASLHACIGAALAALSGPLHGGMTAVIGQHWSAWQAATQPGVLPADWEPWRAPSRQGRTSQHGAGFGHPLYPNGDPRALHLLGLLPLDPAREQLLQTVYQQTGLHPSLDFALVAIERSLGLPRGAAFVLFALGRTAGWMAHVQEQHRSGQLIRPRARYTGQAAAHAERPPPTATGRIVRF